MTTIEKELGKQASKIPEVQQARSRSKRALAADTGFASILLNNLFAFIVEPIILASSHNYDDFKEFFTEKEWINGYITFIYQGQFVISNYDEKLATIIGDFSAPENKKRQVRFKADKSKKIKWEMPFTDLYDIVQSDSKLGSFLAEKINKVNESFSKYFFEVKGKFLLGVANDSGQTLKLDNDESGSPYASLKSITAQGNTSDDVFVPTVLKLGFELITKWKTPSSAHIPGLANAVADKVPYSRNDKNLKVLVNSQFYSKILSTRASLFNFNEKKFLDLEYKVIDFTTLGVSSGDSAKIYFIIIDNRGPQFGFTYNFTNSQPTVPAKTINYKFWRYGVGQLRNYPAVIFRSA